MTTIDLRTRIDEDQPRVDHGQFFQETLPALLDDRQSLIADAGDRLPLPPICFDVDSQPWTLSWQSDRVSIKAGNQNQPGSAHCRLTSKQFSDIVHDQSTPIALLSNALLDMPQGSLPDFLNWWLILRAVLDERKIHRRGDVQFSTELRRSFTPEDSDEDLRHFLEECGYLHIRGFFNSEEMAAIEADFRVAAGHYQKGDVKAWHATTKDDVEHLVRMEGFDLHSAATTELIAQDRFQRLGRIPDCGLVGSSPPGRLAAALNKPIGVVRGISDLPWHKDCSLGRHSYDCCSLTVGLSVTGADAESGQLRVVPGSHRALVWPAPCIQPGLDLEPIDLPTETGDITIHLSCTQHMSQAPITRPRKVVYTNFRQQSENPVKAQANRAQIDEVRGKAHTSISQEPGYLGR